MCKGQLELALTNTSGLSNLYESEYFIESSLSDAEDRVQLGSGNAPTGRRALSPCAPVGTHLP